MPNLSVVPQRNPFPEILELIGYTESVVDYGFLDLARLALFRCNYGDYVCDATVMLALAELSNHGFIQLQQITWPSTVGSVVIIKRILDGKQEPKQDS